MCRAGDLLGPMAAGFQEAAEAQSRSRQGIDGPSSQGNLLAICSRTDDPVGTDQHRQCGASRDWRHTGLGRARSGGD